MEKPFIVVLGINSHDLDSHVERMIEQCIGYPPEGGIQVVPFNPNHEEERATPITYDEYTIIQAYRQIKRKLKKT